MYRPPCVVVFGTALRWNHPEAMAGHFKTAGIRGDFLLYKSSHPKYLYMKIVPKSLWLYIFFKKKEDVT